MTRRTWGLILACFVLTAGVGFVLVGAQGSALSTVRVAAEKAWRSGDYQEVDRLAAAQPEDEPLAVLRARSLAARGDYAGAEAALNPIASQSPGGDAALELGLLQARQGRRTEARRSLQLLLLAAQDADSARDYLRAGRAARALGRFEDANAYFRDGVTLAPADVEVNTAWGELFLEKYNRKDAVRSRGRDGCFRFPKRGVGRPGCADVNRNF